MAGNRPYLVQYKGADRMVEAPSPHAAVSHVVGADVSVVSASGAEMLQWVREGKPIEKAGDKPAIEERRDPVDNPRRVSDAREWFITQLKDVALASEALQAYDYIRNAGEMDLAHFDAITTCTPVLGIALIKPDAAYDEPVEFSDFREKLNFRPLPFDELVERLHERIAFETKKASEQA